MPALLVDIGNSRIKWRIENAAVEAANAGKPSGVLALTDLPQLAQHLRATRMGAPDAVHSSNVAGAEADDALRRAVSDAWGDVVIHPLIPDAARCGVRNGYRDPSQLGSDRWAAMLGAHALAPGRHLLICSFGTATTIDLLLAQDDDDDSVFAGGLILPGFDAMRRALARETARLPMAQGEVVDFALATDDAITSGILAAQAGAVVRALRHARARGARIDRDSGASHPFACLLAGGGAAAMSSQLSDVEAPIHVVPDLVLLGLGEVAREGQRGQGSVHPTLVRGPS